MKFLTGFILGASIFVAMSALAVSYSRDIAPLVEKTSALEERLKRLERLHN